MMAQRIRESTRAAAAYAVYAAMGPGRSLAKLNVELKTLPEWTAKVPSVRRLEAWSSRLSWQARVKEYDIARAEERRVAREALKEKTNEEHFKLGDTAVGVAVEQINRLIEAGKFGSQATVQLLKLATDLQRLSLGLDKPETTQQGPVGIQIIIETDNTPSPQIKSAAQIALEEDEAAHLPALPAPDPAAVKRGEDIIDAILADDD